MRLGFQERGSGKVLLLVHGFPVDSRIWRHQLSDLAGIRRVVAVDLRGRGASPATPDGWNMDTYAGDVAETIEALGVGPVDLAGLSMGGYIAFALMRRRPDLVRTLILVSTRATPDAPEMRAGRDAAAALVAKSGIGALADRMLPRILAEDAPQQIRREVTGLIFDTPGPTAAADTIAMRDRPDSTPGLASIRVPVLVIQGESDSLSPPGSGRQLADAMPDARLALIPAAGHFAPLENPGAVSFAIASFLETATGG
jgi:3-oxoadipate enol-lactonase